jgi:hypothetical protein
LELEGVAASIGSISDAYDYALAESTIGLFKNEAIPNDSAFRNGPLRGLDDVEWATMAWSIGVTRRACARPWVTPRLRNVTPAAEILNRGCLV